MLTHLLYSGNSKGDAMKDYPENRVSIDDVRKHEEEESAEEKKHCKKIGQKRMRLPKGYETDMSAITVYGIPPITKR